MRKIFYRESDLKIMGMSDGEDSMSFPFIETNVDFQTFEFLKIKKVGNQYKLFATRINFDDTEDVEFEIKEETEQTEQTQQLNE